MTVPRLAPLERLILNRLEKGEQFALRLADQSGGSIKRGTVYITLQRMESKGYVESNVEAALDGSTGRPRRWYRPSRYGKQVLEAWKIAEHVMDAAQ